MSAGQPEHPYIATDSYPAGQTLRGYRATPCWTERRQQMSPTGMLSPGKRAAARTIRCSEQSCWAYLARQRHPCRTAAGVPCAGEHLQVFIVGCSYSICFSLAWSNPVWERCVHCKSHWRSLRMNPERLHTRYLSHWCTSSCSPVKKMFRFQCGDVASPTTGAPLDSPYSLLGRRGNDALGSPLASPKRQQRKISRSPFKVLAHPTSAFPCTAICHP